MILDKFTKQPSERKDYDIDYAEWLAPSEDTLDQVNTTVVCLTDPNDTSLEVDRVDMTTSRAKLWIQGGTHGNKYKVTVFVETVGQRSDESELQFTIKDI